MRRSPTRLAALGVAAVLILVCSACDWTQFMGNAALNGVTVDETAITPANVSQLALAYRIALPHSSDVIYSPVTSTGKLFAGTDDGHLVAASTDPSTCTGSPLVCQPLWIASMPGDDLASVPLVSGGLVYDVFSEDGEGAGALAAYDANGVTNCSGSPKTCQPVWTAPVSGIGGANVDAGTLFVANGDTGQLEAFDATGSQGCSGSPTRTCQPLWTAAITSTSVPSLSWSVPSIADGKVYVPNDGLSGGFVAVFDEAGSTDCSGSPKVCQPLFQVAMPTGSAGSVDVAGGVGYVTADLSNNPSDLVAFDANGSTNCSGSPKVCQPLWSAVLSGLSRASTPAVAGGRIYIPSDPPAGGVLEQFDASGSIGCNGSPVVCTPLFTSSNRGVYDYGFASPVVGDGLVVMKNDIYATTTDPSHCSGAPVVCTPLWSAPSDDYKAGSIISNGTVFVPTNDGYIDAYRVPGT